MSQAFVPGNWIQVKSEKICVGLGWDFEEGQQIDLDAAVTAFNEAQEKMVIVFYNNLTGLNGAIKHHGDNRTGEGEGDDEVIGIDLPNIPQEALYLAVSVTSYTQASILKAKSGYIRLFRESDKSEIGRFVLSRTKDCAALLLGLFEKSVGSNDWYFRVMIDPLEGYTPVKSLPSLKKMIGAYTLDDVSNQQPAVQHPLPNEKVFQPQNWYPVTQNLTYVGLGWDFIPGEILDLDASIITFNAANEVVDIIYHKNPKSKDGAITHMGDNRTGLGEGDDEVLSLNLPSVDMSVETIAVVVNSFKGNSMKAAQSGFIRLFDATAPIGCFLLEEAQDCTGLFLGILRRDYDNNAWQFQGIIEPVQGIQASESVNDVKSKLDTYLPC